MSQYRVLVADDQPEIARALVSGLSVPEFHVEFVTDAAIAVDRLTAGDVIDAVVVDMRMPPDVWGGLWLIEKVRSMMLNVPVIVLSGEAGQTETIRALRLGANDWVSKDDAIREIRDRVEHQLKEAEARALASPPVLLPTPIAEKVAHYKEVLARDGSELERGLAVISTVEAIWRFLSLVNLAALDSSQGLRGVVEPQLIRPSMGTFLDLLKVTRELTQDNGAPSRLCSCMPMDKASEVVRERNRGVGHPIGAPGLDQSVIKIAESQLLTFLRRFADSGLGYLGGVHTMTYEGNAFRMDMRVHGASLTPRLTFESDHPLPSGETFWVSASGVVRLWPWIIEDECDVSNARTVFLFDGVKVKGKDLKDLAAPFIYSGCSSRGAHECGGRLGDLKSLFPDRSAQG